MNQNSKQQIHKVNSAVFPVSVCASYLEFFWLQLTNSGWNIEMRSFNSTFSWLAGLSNSGKFTAGWFNSATILWLSAMSETDCHLELKTGYIISLVRNKTQPGRPSLRMTWRVFCPCLLFVCLDLLSSPRTHSSLSILLFSFRHHNSKSGVGRNKTIPVYNVMTWPW